MNSQRLRQILATGLMIAASMSLAACVNKTPGKPLEVAQPDDYEATSAAVDPIEPVNRQLFEVNEVIDGVILSPIAHIYRGVVPTAGQNGIRNALTNLASPVVLLNSLLQGDFANANHTVTRFVVNSTVGVAGFFDVASVWGIPKQHGKDFGQTLGVYGVPAGPYIFIPILGPSDVRDTFGRAVDFFSDPFYYVLNGNAYIALDIARGVVKRADLFPLTDQMHRDSLDVYTTYRSTYLQNRAKVIKDYKGADSSLEKESGK